jgi:hypothetical protein
VYIFYNSGASRKKTRGLGRRSRNPALAGAPSSPMRLCVFRKNKIFYYNKNTMNAIRQARMLLEQKNKTDVLQIEEIVDGAEDETGSTSESNAAPAPDAKKEYSNTCFLFSGRLVETRILGELYNLEGAVSLHIKDSVPQEEVTASIVSLLKSKTDDAAVTRFVTQCDTLRIEDFNKLLDETDESLRLELFSTEPKDVTDVLVDALTHRDRVTMHNIATATNIATVITNAFPIERIFKSRDVFSAFRTNDAFRSNLFAMWNYEMNHTSGPVLVEQRLTQLEAITDIDAPLKYYKLGRVSQYSSINLSPVSTKTVAVDYVGPDVVDFLSFVKTVRESIKENTYKNYLVFHRNYATKTTIVIGIVESPHFNDLVKFVESSHNVKINTIPQEKENQILFECSLPVTQDTFLGYWSTHVDITRD